ncbi:MbtH family protein [Nocardia terpenica]|uniref:MbtH family NRPS accessory protein n=1 Tax=Nocardia terpenica TaxID=455432 RepID=A0A6G9Z9B3_9NOCA|nr:MbtH family protein [Nocardia terpenica]QIS22054.1 MbtH family NRPS accessory protein [Nocardia terpenica]
MADNQQDDRTYRVVINDEAQYSIWVTDRELPAGWHAEGKEGSRQECLDHIDEVWVDMRPLSLRRRMEQNSVG